jgi:hypothetical protein
MRSEDRTRRKKPNFFSLVLRACNVCFLSSAPTVAKTSQDTQACARQAANP